jgi:glutathione S-transferase
MATILYSGTRNASSWAMRAWLALREQDIDFEERIIDLRKPQRFNQLATVGKFSPPAAVPVLVTDTTIIFDSLAIMEFASEKGETPLLPDDIELRARSRSFMAWQHAGLSNICPRLSFESSFYPDRRALTDAEISDADRLFAVLEEELSNHDGNYLFDELSLADLALVPTAVRLHAHGPDFGAWPRTQQWFESILARDTVCEWLNEARLLPHIWFDDYLPDKCC